MLSELKKHGYFPFSAANRLHVVPPCNVSDAEVAEGLAILETVFSMLDKHYEG
jgi:taurine--2-oxoglutarate transaminase